MKTITNATLLLLLWSGMESAHAQSGFWQQTSGPFGGTVYTLASGREESVLIGADGGGIFYSIDGGENWKQANTGNMKIFVGDFAYHPNGDIFAGSFGTGIWRSTDHGRTWVLVNSGLTNKSVASLAINAKGYIFAGTFGAGGGIFRSKDNGASWTLVNVGLTSINVNTLAINAQEQIFAGTDGGGIFRSLDDGDSWVAINTGLSATSIESIAINSKGHLFVRAFDQMFRSLDNGESWMRLTGFPRSRVLAIAVNSSDHIWVGTYEGVLRSRDNGDHWETVDLGLPNVTVFALAFNANDHVFAGTFACGILRSTDDGMSWSSMNTGFSATVIASLVAPSKGHIFAGSSRTIFDSRDAGENWKGSKVEVLYNSYVSDFAIHPDGGIWAGTSGDGLFRSTNDGQSWSRLITAPITAIAINAKGHIFVANGDGVLRSLDNGNTWAEINEGLFNRYTSSLTITPQQSIFLGTLDSYMPVVGTIYRSTDNGEHWEGVYFWRDQDVLTLASNTEGHIFAGLSLTGIFRSTDNGDHWAAVNNGLPALATVRAIVFDSKGRVFTGMGGTQGVFLSANNGDSWEPINTGLTNATVFSLTIDSSGYLYAGTYGSGVFRSVEPITAVAENNYELPQLLVLHQNHPNPFNPSTTISFSLSRASFVALKIYNLLGEEVATLVHEHREAGEHRVQWQPHDLPSGVYVYRLQTGEAVQSKKLLLMR